MDSGTGQGGPTKDDRAQSVERMLEGDDPPVEPSENDPGGSTPAPGTEDVGESSSRGGEDVAQQEGEPGRTETGTDDTGRPTGTSSDRDVSGVDP